jgi:hypothetical protein
MNPEVEHPPSPLCAPSEPEVCSPHPALDPAHFSVDSSGPVQDAHVLVVEDSWVTGGHSQFVAVALKHAGAAAVTVLPVCRLLKPAWAPNIAYSPHRRPWSTDTCPVTGSACPRPEPLRH